jgi:hypothetical protein
VKLPKKKRSLWGWITWIWQQIWWKLRGEALHHQLQDHASPLRSEAQIAVDRVVYETKIAPDCVMGAVVRGGPAIILKHDPHGNGATQTVFIGKTYEHAATEAIAWLKTQGSELTTKKVSQLRRADARKFDAIRRQKQRKRRRRH